MNGNRLSWRESRVAEGLIPFTFGNSRCLFYFREERCDVSKNDSKDDSRDQKIDKELDQQVEPKEMPDSTGRKQEASKSPRRER
jgi:hypothetical protein